jgi:mannitol/fructose-specific phosphotransferase system IIA component (Ntr-type)
MMSEVAKLALEEDIRAKWLSATSEKEIVSTFNKV